MAKDFDFQMHVICVMFKLTVQLACTTTTNLHKLHSYEVGLTQFFIKLENLSVQQTAKPITLYTSNCICKLNFWAISYRHRYYFLICTQHPGICSRATF